MVMALAQRLRNHGCNVQLVTRGYRGRIRGPVEVDIAVHDSADVGDEALLIAGFARTWKSRDRYAGTVAAVDAGAEVIILDDGHQNPRPVRDLSLLVVDANHGFGNGRVIPAGPLRESIANGMSRADMLIVIGEEMQRDEFLNRWRGMPDIPVTTARLEILPTGIDWPDTRVYGFAGIGHPEKFRSTLGSTGAAVAGFRALADHQPLDEMLMQRLEHDAAGLNAQLVTTEKDATRLPAAWKRKVLTLPVRLVPDDWTLLDRSLQNMGIASLASL